MKSTGVFSNDSRFWTRTLGNKPGRLCVSHAAERMDPNSSRRCTMRAWDSTPTRWNTGNSDWVLWEIFSVCQGGQTLEQTVKCPPIKMLTTWLGKALSKLCLEPQELPSNLYYSVSLWKHWKKMKGEVQIWIRKPSLGCPWVKVGLYTSSFSCICAAWMLHQYECSSHTKWLSQLKGLQDDV